MAVVNDDKLYFASFENDITNKKISHTIWRFDFKTEQKTALCQREETMSMDPTLPED
jgi:hypothetical protein